MKKYLISILLSLSLLSSKSQLQVFGVQIDNACATDADAIYFLTATGITNTTICGAINQLVLSFKSAGIWTKFGAIYPIVGGTASTHKYNLKDPRDLDAAFRLVFDGTWTQSSTGALPNGASIAHTYFIPDNNSLALANNSLSFYSGTSAAGVDASNIYYEMGGGSTPGGYAMFTRRQNNTAAYDAGDGSNRATTSNTDGSGMYVGSATTTTGYLYKNGTQIASNVNSATVQGGFEIYLGGFNQAGTVTYYSNKECRFASLGLGLNPTESTALYNAVLTFETTLGRN